MIKKFKDFLKENLSSDRGEDLAAELGIGNSLKVDMDSFLKSNDSSRISGAIGFIELMPSDIEFIAKEFIRKHKNYSEKEVMSYLKAKFRGKLAKYLKRLKESGRSYIPPIYFT